MATVTEGPEPASVGIDSRMTVVAGSRQLLLGKRKNVTGKAIESGMRSLEGEVCLAAVIEAPEFPAIWRMAALADITESFFVRILFVVTSAAVSRCIFEDGVDMASLAGRDGVHADEGEIGQVVIKEDFGPPPLEIMAFVASLAFLALVRIILAVTGDAGGG